MKLAPLKSRMLSGRNAPFRQEPVPEKSLCRLNQPLLLAQNSHSLHLKGMAWIRNTVRSDSIRASKAALVIAEKIATPDNSQYPAAMPEKI